MRKQTRFGGSFGFDYLDLTHEELVVAPSSGKPHLILCNSIDDIGKYIREKPEDVKHIEANTRRTILHRVIKLMAEDMNYKGPLLMNHKELLDALIQAFPEASEKRDTTGKYAADYTHLVIAAFGYNKEPSYFIGEELASSLLDYLIDKGCKHTLHSIKNRLENASASSDGYKGRFFSTDERRENELMLEEYRKILNSEPR